MKLCKDCVWCSHTTTDSDYGRIVEYWYCLYGMVEAQDEVTGWIHYKGKNQTCYEARRSAFCGGKHYKRKWYLFWRPK